MDKLDHYRDVIERNLNEFVTISARALGSDKYRDQAVFDRHNDNYIIFREG